MSAPILATKLYIPPTRPKIVLRSHLVRLLNDGLHRKLTLISAPAGFGKTTLVCEWVAVCARPAAWLSLDAEDNDPPRFLIYLIAALQTIYQNIGKGVLGLLQSPQPPPVESMLTALLNEIVAVPGNFVLVLDDYHVIDAKAVDHAINFLIEHLPPQMHLVITTREDPDLFLPRLRARNQLTELRVTDMRFTPSEAAEFLNQVMELKLTTEDITSLETRTEGWIAGLQLAAIALQGPMSMQGHKDTASFIRSFSGSHHFVMDYLLQEVLGQQSESVQTFLLHTSILDRMCGPLCDAVLINPDVSGQEILEYIEHVNLFIVPLDNERRWYRYHHLFADLLRQRLYQSQQSNGDAKSHVNELHIRASQWYEDNGLEIEAFHHAAAGNDIERTERLIEGKGILLHDRGVVTAILKWLESLPTVVLNERPWLWWKYASLLLANGQTTGVEEKLQAAEAALQGARADDKTQNLIGQIATARATVALTRYQVETMLVQSQRALEYLNPDNLPYRATANWALGYAYLFQGDRSSARQALTEAISLSEICGDIFTTILATIGLGNIHEGENQLHLAAETYQRVLQLAGDQPLQIISEAHLGLARVLYEWHDLDASQGHAEQGLQLARQYEKVIDRFILSEIFLARLKLARRDGAGALAILAQAEQSSRQPNFVHRIPEVVAAQVLTLLHLGDLTAAALLIQTQELPVIIQARVHLALGDTSIALAMLEPLRQAMDERGWADEQLKIMVLQAITFHAHGEKDRALQLLAEALTLAEPGGFIRIFVDEGSRMAVLLSEAAAQGMRPDYISKLLAVFEAEEHKGQDKPDLSAGGLLIEPLSPRELEVLQLIAQGLSNDEISQRLFLALSTVKGHNRIIFGKLQVQRRTEAVARARELGLL